MKKLIKLVGEIKNEWGIEKEWVKNIKLRKSDYKKIVKYANSRCKEKYNIDSGKYNIRLSLKSNPEQTLIVWYFSSNHPFAVSHMASEQFNEHLFKDRTSLEACVEEAFISKDEVLECIDFFLTGNKET